MRKFLTSLLLILVVSVCAMAQQHIRINEIVASNSSGLVDKDGDYSDWIELYNFSEEVVNLAGWTLTDNPDEKSKWIFPEITLNPGEFLLLIASGKDHNNPANELHTNFKINNEGEFIGLYDEEGNPISVLEGFPPLENDYSYSYENDNYFRTSTPTPGAVNIISGTNQLTPPVFSVSHGYYDETFLLEITAENLNSNIYYTTNGSVPDPENGISYTDPVSVTTTTVIRAVSVIGEYQSPVSTSSYLFIDDIIRQPNDPPGYPDIWGEYYESDGVATADYEMDPEIQRDREYRNLLEDAFLSLPALSIVTDIDHLFSHNPNPDSGGIYIYTGNYGSDPGKGWERPVSIEVFNAEEGLDFQENAGLELNGFASRLAEKTPKHSFRISFKEKYGNTRLEHPFFGEDVGENFNSIVLRATYGNSWLNRRARDRPQATLIRDVWAKDTQLDMGHPAGTGRYMHVFINGLYWGIYNPTERIREDFGQRHLGGDEEDYDVIKDWAELVSGTKDAWNEMDDLLDNDMTVDENYYRLIGKNEDGSDNNSRESYLDLENFIDYMLINYFGANWDWDSKNWTAIRNREHPGNGFRFISWDAEHILEQADDFNLDIINNGRPTGFFNNLIASPHFRMLVGDRVYKHFYNGGALTPEANIERLLRRASELELAIITESARWGDYRRDVHPQYGSPELYTKEHWDTQISYFIEEYFPQRHEIFLDQLIDAGWIPSILPPKILINGKASDGIINPGDTLTFEDLEGDIYFTLNGIDPYDNGFLHDSALLYSEPVILEENTVVKVRLIENAEWSAVNEQELVITNGLENLRLTEIQYHPLPEAEVADGNFEFIELKNTGTDTLSLDGIYFADGIEYQFTEGEINPGEFIVLASNKERFKERYQFDAFDEFEGALDNTGERIVLASPAGDTLIEMEYGDELPWPETADGDGFSLVTKDVNGTANPDDPSVWRASTMKHGSPGSDDPEVETNLENIIALPKDIKLEQNYPNPFNPGTRIEFELPERINVRLTVYDILGRQVAELQNEVKASGSYSVYWDASAQASGVYIYRLVVGDQILTRRMLLIK